MLLWGLLQAFHSSLGRFHIIPMCLPDCSVLISRHDWWVLIQYSVKELILITRSEINHQFAVSTDTADPNRLINSDQYDRSAIPQNILLSTIKKTEF